jgi:hypothetical protein
MWYHVAKVSVLYCLVLMPALLEVRDGCVECCLHLIGCYISLESTLKELVLVSNALSKFLKSEGIPSGELSG